MAPEGDDKICQIASHSGRILDRQVAPIEGCKKCDSEQSKEDPSKRVHIDCQAVCEPSTKPNLIKCKCCSSNTCEESKTAADSNECGILH